MVITHMMMHMGRFPSEVGTVTVPPETVTHCGMLVCIMCRRLRNEEVIVIIISG